MRRQQGHAAVPWRRIGAGALVMASLVLAACGGDDDDAGASTSGAVETTEPADPPAADSADTSDAPDGAETTTGATEPAPATGDVPNGGTLRYARTDVTNLDPHKATVGPDAEILFLTYDRLVHTNADGSLTGGLAESWEVSPDGLTLTLHVREGVTFHDGAPLDAEAVKANLERAKTVEGSAVSAELTPVTEVVVVDPLTVDVKLAAPAGNLPAILSDRAGALISPAALANADLDRRPVGAGMYTVVDYEPAAGATFERAAEYWDPDAQRLDAIEWTVIADSEAMYNALRTDQIDVATLPPSYIDRAEQDGLDVISGPTRQVYYLNLNETRPGLDDVRVRRAIAQSINRQGIVDAVFFGHGEPASQLLPAGETGHNDDIAADAFGFDPAGAKDLLAEAGFAEGDLSYELISFPSSPVPEINQVILDGLAQAGIHVELRTVDSTAVAETYFVRQEGDMMQGAWSGRPSAEQSIQLLHTSSGFGNPGGFTPEGFDDLLATALAATTDDDRSAALDELAQVAFDEVLSVPIVFPYTSVGAQDRVEGLQIYVTGKLEFRGVGINE